ncbi:signal peptidase I [Clostridium fallax]|uniref:Signal peptidase I n=1 Tax=Clostridium fallax TaxID=1533 RepID=A0A1M4W342_9CLOT|nr:signal peptidase I [Clostridium fallax]SQB22851.1 signal peptidase I [Clostridium fallax]
MNVADKFKIKDILGILLVIIIIFLIKKFLILTVYIPSGSMIPTLKPGNVVVATKVYKPRDLKRGDIVIFRSNERNENMIKRLIGLPGDEIEVKGTLLYVNGKKLDEPYIKNNIDFEGTYKVPNEEYFFLGDNRASSLDSRFWNDPYISANNIIGKAQFRIWPLNSIEFLK